TCVWNQAAPITAPLYAMVEGVAIGALSMILEQAYPGIVIEAVAATFAVFGVVLLLYRARVLRATPVLTKVIITATGAIALTYLVSVGVMLFGGHVPFLNDATPLGIGISLFTSTIAALNFVLDFDMIERGANQGAPKFMEWYAGFSLLVTLIWLYV